MNHLIEIKEIRHTTKEGRLLWKDANLKNLIHSNGEKYLLEAVMIGGKLNNTFIPSNYYFGLDDRVTVAVDDLMSTIQEAGAEPGTGYGYQRQTIASYDQFVMTITESGYNQAYGPVIYFSASGDSWGPVRNLFMTTQNDNTGYLIASVTFPSAITVNDGDSISMRMGLAMRDCPVT